MKKDIQRLYSFLIEYQELDPLIARRILENILIILQDMKTPHFENSKTDESAGKDL